MDVLLMKEYYWSMDFNKGFSWCLFFDMLFSSRPRCFSLLNLTVTQYYTALSYLQIISIMISYACFVLYIFRFPICCSFCTQFLCTKWCLATILDVHEDGIIYQKLAYHITGHFNKFGVLENRIAVINACTNRS